MSAVYTKLDLVRELAQSARISRRRVEAVLEALALIAYREARQGFAVPGICRLNVVHRRARQVRNPQTGETLLVAEHDTLRVRPVKRARNAVAPTPKALVQVLPAAVLGQAGAPLGVSTPAATAGTVAPTAAVVAPVEAAATPPVPAAMPAGPLPAQPAPQPEEGAAAGNAILISFRCTGCGQEIEAPLEMVGTPNECPTCGESLVVPYTSEPGTIWYRERMPTGAPAPAPTPQAVAAMKSRTIRIELPDDI